MILSVTGPVCSYPEKKRRLELSKRRALPANLIKKTDRIS